MTRGRVKAAIKVTEGDIFAVPLPDGGYGRVVVARKGRGGVLLGYFFGPRYAELPATEDARGLHAASALSCEKFGDLGIQEKSWAPLGRVEPWDRTQWPLPPFGRIADEALGMAWIDTYVDNDLRKPIVQRRCSPEEARRHPSNSLSGCDAVAMTLAMRLRGEKVPW